MARGGSGILVAGLLSLGVGGGLWLFGLSVLGDLDPDGIRPLDEADVGRQAWAEGVLEGPEVIRYGKERGKGKDRELEEPGPKTLGFVDAADQRHWTLRATDLEYTGGTWTSQDASAEHRVDLGRMAVLGEVTAPGELRLLRHPDAGGLDAVISGVRNRQRGAETLGVMAACAWVFGGFLVLVGAFLSVGRKSAVPHGYLYNLWWVDVPGVVVFSGSWGVGTYALVGAWRPDAGAFAGLFMGALFLWRVGGGLISGFRSWRTLPHWSTYWPHHELEDCDPAHIWRARRHESPLGRVYAWDQGSLLGPDNVVLLQVEGEETRVWRVRRALTEQDLVAVGHGGQPGDPV